MTFREWMIQKHIKGEPFTIDELLAKYDELEPGPKFKVGDEVMCMGYKLVVEEVVKFAYKFPGTSAVFTESELTPLPKKKKVFSLEKWVEKSMKRDGAKFVINAIDSLRRFDGKTLEELKSMTGQNYNDEPDLFAEVDE